MRRQKALSPEKSFACSGRQLFRPRKENGTSTKQDSIDVPLPDPVSVIAGRTSFGRGCAGGVPLARPHSGDADVLFGAVRNFQAGTDISRRGSQQLQVDSVISFNGAFDAQQ